MLADRTGNGIVYNVHYCSSCAIVQICFWNNTYNALDCNGRSNTYVCMQKDAVVLTMTSDKWLHTLSLAPISSPFTLKWSHGVTYPPGMLYKLFYVFSSFSNLRVCSHTVLGLFLIFSLLIHRFTGVGIVSGDVRLLCQTSCLYAGFSKYYQRPDPPWPESFLLA